MAELPGEVYGEVKRLCAEGDDLAAGGDVEEALAQFQAAWALLPPPKLNWSAALWILAAIGDVHFQRGEFAESRKVLMTAMKSFGEALDNPFLRMRLGQSLFEMGELKEAANWLAPAFLSEGMKLFGREDPKYVAFLKSKLDPPAGRLAERMVGGGRPYGAGGLVGAGTCNKPFSGAGKTCHAV